MKKLCILFLTVCLFGALLLGLAACDETPANQGDIPSDENPSGDQDGEGGGENNGDTPSGDEVHEHSFTDWIVTQAATCVKTGQRYHICMVCGISPSEIIPVDANAHDYAAEWTSDGENHWRICQNTGCTSVTPSEEHAFGEWIVDANATCVSTGERHHICSVCEKNVSEIIPVDANAHDYAAEWTSDGENHWQVCQNTGCTAEPKKTAHSLSEESVCTVCRKDLCAGLTFALKGDGTYEVSGFDGSSTVVVIPSLYNGIAVTGIGQSAFYEWGCLVSVIIPESVTSIGYEAFAYSSLSSITLPDSITSIGMGAFYDTGYYRNESNWENGVLYIGKYLIKAKNTLSGSYVIRDGTLGVAPGAFAGCADLISVTVPSGVTFISFDAFRMCENLATVELPESVISVGTDAFEGTGIYNDDSNWENGVLYIGKCLIRAEESLSGAYAVKEGTVCIAGEAFGYCNRLTSVAIPASVVEIGSRAFISCSKLSSVTLAEESKLVNISYQVFLSCADLSSLCYGGTKAQWNEIKKGDNWDQNTPDYTVYCIDGEVSK